jgi:hypothetical protein
LERDQTWEFQSSRFREGSRRRRRIFEGTRGRERGKWKEERKEEEEREGYMRKREVRIFVFRGWVFSITFLLTFWFFPR